MIRLRKYRIFLVVAIAFLLVIWYVGRDASWNESDGDSGLTGSRGYGQLLPNRKEDNVPSTNNQAPIQINEKDETPYDESSGLADSPRVFPKVRLPESGQQVSRSPGNTRSPPPKATEPLLNKEEAAAAATATPKGTSDLGGSRAQSPASKTQSASSTGPPSATVIADEQEPQYYYVASPHTYSWKAKSERYPVPSGSTIPLPSGTPKSIPRIQFDFKPDPPSVVNERVVLRNSIRDSMKRTWDGYKKFAWMMDELRPESGASKDKFMGWAATLIDSLDTLYIMGLEREFEEAVNATAHVDFTRSTHTRIPMFETTIRYLGGLLGAYDISGGRYPVLLDKAVELGEILMGAFDTPNRMPVLYYMFTEPHGPGRASRSSGLAELGSFAVEFTRLAQLTKEPRYYDAIARITDGLEELQRSSTIPGLLPLHIDASGCVATQYGISRYNDPIRRPSGLGKVEPTNSSTNSLPISSLNKDVSSFGDDSISAEDATDSQSAQEMYENSGFASFAHDVGEAVEDEVSPFADEAELHASKDTTSFGDDSGLLTKRQLAPENSESLTVDDSEDGATIVRSATPRETCIRGGLTTGQSYYGGERFTLGAEADSAYEYLPKQYLLLGGLNEQYRKMYSRSQAAIKEYLLYRPMINDTKRDLLFTGSFKPFISKTDVPGRRNGTMDPTVGHLTCFVGAMFALGAKIFNEPEELEMAAKLTDGCVWAYESTATGIMPEDFVPQPCESMISCSFNETAWHLAIDPAGEARDAIAQKPMASSHEPLAVDALAKPMPGAPPPIDPAAKFEDFVKRQLESDDLGEDEAEMNYSDEELLDSQSTYAEDVPSPVSAIDDLEYEDDSNSDGFGTPPPKHTISQPLNHADFVKKRIDDEHLWPGITDIKSKRYLLRPEAIESVFYMYRITGEQEWRRKGVRMYMSIDAATKVKYGNSAIMDVTNKAEPSPMDEMESFWPAETLKYFYLLFSDPDVVSLDDYVFNTEAHPLLRPDASVKKTT